jgi:hypothetical protein
LSRSRVTFGAVEATIARQDVQFAPSGAMGGKVLLFPL